MKPNIAEKILLIRQTLGMSRREFADSLGIKYGAVSNYEYGVRIPRRDICYRIIDLAKTHKIKIRLEDINPRSV